MKSVIACTLLSLFAAAAASANPEAVRREFEKKYPEIKPEKISRAGFGDLWEIFTAGEIVYTDDKVSFLLLGSLINAATKENVTEARLQKLTAIDFKELPLQHAIKLVRGNGARKLAVFEDPNCGYCKRFERDLNELENVTVYIFPFPILSADSMEKSKAIWCSPDRLKAWQDWMLRNVVATAKTTCDNPIDKIVAFGQKHRIQGTPMTYFENGERASGAFSKEQLEARIAAASATLAAAK